MSKKKRTLFDASEDTTRGKGDILEEIIESMHMHTNAKVERNVFLPVLHGTDRRREIDVLISGQVGGYPVQIAVECKNMTSPIEVGDIDAFIGKLIDVGIPVMQGIYVTSSQYRSGAIDRAKKVGIQTLLYKNVNDDIPKSVANTVQSLIYILLTITKIEVTNDFGGKASMSEVIFFTNDQGKICGSVPDLMWKKWIEGDLIESLGKHSVEIDTPSDWHQHIQGNVVNIRKILVEYKVTAQLLNLHGSIDQHHLIEQDSGKLSRYQVPAIFDPPEGKYPVNEYEDESALMVALANKATIHISWGRLKLPRIVFMSIYWPPSKKTMEILFEKYTEAVQCGENFDFSQLTLGEIEGSDLRAVWEPIIDDHPFVKTNDND